MSNTIATTVHLPILPEGYEYTGEYRDLVGGDFFFCSGVVHAVSEAPPIDRTACWHVVSKSKWEPKIGDEVFIFVENFNIKPIFFDPTVVRHIQLHRKGSLIKSKDAALFLRDKLLASMALIDVNNLED